MRWLILPALASLAACGGGDKTAADASVDATLSPREQLIRLSLDLRGIRPTEDELVAIDADPSTYDQKVDEYLHDPRFLDQVEDLYNGVLRTRTIETYQDPAEAGLALSSWEVADSVGSEPLKIISHVVDQDLPFSEILTASYTFADATTAAMWGLPYTGPGWQQTAYTDGRPAAGVLSTTTLWQRYPSAGLNSNRHRANQLSRMFLCDDYLTRPVEFTRDALDGLTPDEANDVIDSNPTCQSCHSSLDPIAANFFGFWWEKDVGLANNRTYVAGDEGRWSENFAYGPAYYGQPITGLAELAQDLSQDQRFYECTVKTVLGGLTQRSVTDDDWDQVQDFTATFIGSGLNFRELVRAVVESDSYKAASFAGDTGERIPVVKTLSPRQLASYIADKTCYVLSFGGEDALTEPDLGLVVLAGGIDGEYVVDRSYEPSVSSLFVQERLAQAAGYSVALHDLNRGEDEDAILLDLVHIDSTPDADADAFHAQVESIWTALVGKPLPSGSTEADELVDLWREAFSVSASPTTAWAAVIAAILRDPEILFY